MLLLPPVPFMDTSEYNHLEQDNSTQDGGDELPTYDDLAAQNGPNSRYVIVKAPGLSNLR